jgi:hypothetical protein
MSFIMYMIILHNTSENRQRKQIDDRLLNPTIKVKEKTQLTTKSNFLPSDVLVNYFNIISFCNRVYFIHIIKVRMYY